MKKRKRKFRIGLIRDIFLTLVLIGITTASICAVVFAQYIQSDIVPRVEVDIAGLTTNLTSVVYYEDKITGEYKELEKLHGEQNRIWAIFDEIPDDLKIAFVSIEDERFYEHSGVDWKRTAGAVVNWILPLGGSYGGSTITQQLIKNVTEDNDFKVTRKITEIMRAINIEEKLSKDEILEMYMNTIYFGRGAYGVNTAASTYFGKELSELNLAECAVLAGLTNNPSKYDPFRYPENVKMRQETILTKMFELGHITESQKDEAIAYDLIYVYEVNEEIQTSHQSYFVDALVEDVIADLMDEKGYSRQVATQLLYTSGFQIYATVDLSVQTAMEDIYKDDSNFPDIVGKNDEIPQSSMVVMDPSNGHVVGIVGGRGEKVGDRILNRATQTTRQPGSSIKPIAVYAPALDQGVITPISAIDDSPHEFETSTIGWPKNSYTGYRGMTSIAQAVANSVNTVAVKVLDMLGTRESYNFLTANLGITTLSANNDQNISPLALGGLYNGLTVLELTASYVPFANEGVYYEPITYTQILDASGNTIIENQQQAQAVFSDPDTVFYMRTLLEGVVTGGTAAGVGVKVPGMQTIGKTGTTNDVYDSWFAGATPYYVGATWFGYDNPQRITNTRGALTLWKAVMNKIHEDLPAKNFESASNFVSVSYCYDSGLKATSLCGLDPRGSRARTAYLSPSDVPTSECNLHTEIVICGLSGGIAHEYCPEESWTDRVLMDITRLFEKDIYLTDEIYTISWNNEPIGSGVSALRTEDGSDPIYTGVLCELHSEETYLLELEELLQAELEEQLNAQLEEELANKNDSLTTPEIPEVPQTPSVDSTTDTEQTNPEDFNDSSSGDNLTVPDDDVYNEQTAPDNNDSSSTDSSSDETSDSND